MSVAVLLDNFVAASTRLEQEVKEEHIRVIKNNTERKGGRDGVREDV